MDAEQAWQAALGQLQMEMSKSSFDTWVRDARLISYQDGQFSIGVRNDFACDWLESRLSSTVNRLLMGMMNRNVTVQFVIADDEPTAEGANLTPVSVLDEVVLTENDAAGISKDDEMEIEAHYELAYDKIVIPDHVTVVPGYFRRHLRVIGPDLGWLYLGFRQAAFNAGGRSGSKHARFSGKTIASLSGIAERTFWNRIGNAETWKRLHGLVTTTQASPEWDTHSATPRRLPRRYTVAMSLPLTAADARSLSIWLVQNLEKLGGPEQAIEAASQTPLNQLLPLDAQAQKGDSPESIYSIIRRLFGEILQADRQVALATRLQKYIMPDNDRMGVTHFFVEHILPYLGAGPSWMLTLLRDRCYFNRDTGEERDRVTVTEGYAEIARWVGLLRPKTVWEWLRDPIMQIYVRCESSGMGESKWTAPRVFQVFLNEIPSEILQMAIGQDEWRDFQYCSGATFSIGVARFAEDSGASFSIAVARLAEFSGAICRVLKSLNYLNPITNDSPSPLPPSKATGSTPHNKHLPTWGAGNQAFWDFNFLMQNNQVARAADILKRQKETGASIENLAKGFVSWLLYAYSPAGKRIENPVALATKRLLENVHAGAGGDFDYLARLRPFEVKAIFDKDLVGKFPARLSEARTQEEAIYAQNFLNMAEPYKRELYRRLFGGE